HVDQEGQHAFVLGRRVHLRDARPELLFGELDVALMDFGAVDLGQYFVFGADGTSQKQHGKTAGQARGDKETRGVFRYRERGGHEKSSSCSGLAISGRTLAQQGRLGNAKSLSK